MPPTPRRRLRQPATGRGGTQRRGPLPQTNPLEAARNSALETSVAAVTGGGVLGSGLLRGAVGLLFAAGLFPFPVSQLVDPVDDIERELPGPAVLEHRLVERSGVGRALLADRSRLRFLLLDLRSEVVGNAVDDLLDGLAGSAWNVELPPVATIGSGQ